MNRRSMKVLILLAVSCVVVTACGSERSGSVGEEKARLADCPASPNCVSSMAADNRHRIDPLDGGDDPGVTFARLEQLMSSRKDTRIVEKQPGYLRVVFHTTFFQDDAAFLLDEQHGVIDVWSASRVGYWDLGKNRRRIEEIRRGLER